MAAIDIRKEPGEKIDCIRISDEIVLFIEEDCVKIKDSSTDWIAIHFDNHYEEVDNLIKGLQKVKEIRGGI